MTENVATLFAAVRKERFQSSVSRHCQCKTQTTDRRLQTADCRPGIKCSVVTKAWNNLKPPKTIYNHLKPPTTTSKNSTTPYNHLQPPQKHLQPLANNLKPSKTGYKYLFQNSFTQMYVVPQNPLV